MILHFVCESTKKIANYSLCSFSAFISCDVLARNIITKKAEIQNVMDFGFLPAEINLQSGKLIAF